MSEDIATIKLRNVRLSFPSLFKPSASIENGPLKFRANFLIDPSTPEGKDNVKKLTAARKQLELESFKREMTYKDPKRCCISKGEDNENQKGEVYDGYEGMIVVKATSDQRVPIVDQKRNPLSAEDNKPYAGCRVNAVIRLYTVKDPKKGGNGLFAGLQAVQFLRDDTPFGSGPVNPNDVFDEEEVTDDEDDLI